MPMEMNMNVCSIDEGPAKIGKPETLLLNFHGNVEAESGNPAPIYS